MSFFVYKSIQGDIQNSFRGRSDWRWDAAGGLINSAEKVSVHKHLDIQI